MCGIAGIIMRDGSQPSRGLLERLGAALTHRGPDGMGFHLAPGVGFVQTRLAIIDLKTGDQPIHVTGPDGREATIIANGEIYNYVELRLDLGRVKFRTKSDCELPLQLYLREDLEFQKHLRGMYALAIHEPGRDRVVLSRDPFGIKPLYFVENTDCIAFASEPQALIKAGLAAPELDTDARDEVLQMQFSAHTRTPFAAIHRLQPGETLVIEGGRLVGRNVMGCLDTGAPTPQRPRDALDKLDGLLNEAVGMHQRSDVPYGMFFSGGIDSSVLLAMMARLNEHPVKAFTAGFPGTDVHDERALARELAASVQADHVDVEFGEDDFWSSLPEIAAAMDDPAADYAVLPTYKLAKTAREHGLKVILSGEGGDEIFGGYGRYRRAARPRLLGGRTMRERGILEGLGLTRETGRAWRTQQDARSAEALDHGWTAFQQAQAVDIADWLPNDLLTKLDRCLMAHGVEGRVPFLDPRLAAFGFGLPDALKQRRGRGKWLLRKWLETALPGCRPFSAKRGFTVPVGEWIAKRGAELGPLVASQPGVEECCHPDRVAALFRSSGKRELQAAWTLLFYAVWHQHHIVGVPHSGDVLDVLAEPA